VNKLQNDDNKTNAISFANIRDNSEVLRVLCEIDTAPSSTPVAVVRQRVFKGTEARLYSRECRPKIGLFPVLVQGGQLEPNLRLILGVERAISK
jgi:hypothetical protein